MLGLSLLKGLVIAAVDRTPGFRLSATTQRLSTVQINLSPFTKDFCVLGCLLRLIYLLKAAKGSLVINCRESVTLELNLPA